MSTHWKGLAVLLLATLAAVILGTFWSPYLGLGAFVVMVVLLFVLGTAWMRPRGERR